jgi:hypothetical protein
MCASVTDRPERFSLAWACIIIFRPGHRIAPSVSPHEGFRFAGYFPEGSGAGSFLPESFARIELSRVCTFGAFHFYSTNFDQKSLLFGKSLPCCRSFVDRVHCKSNSGVSQDRGLHLEQVRMGLRVRQYIAYPVTHQPVFEILALVDLHCADDAVYQRAYRHER